MKPGKIQVIGDEIHFEGELVAILTTNAAETHRGRFTDALDVCEEGALIDVLDKVEKRAAESMRGGLLRAADLSKIIASLKEG